MLDLDEPPNDFLRDIPNNLSVPVDDGACNHLEGLTLPSVDLPSTTGGTINPSQIPGWLVIYCYPMTGRPGRVIPDGWVQIPEPRAAHRNLARSVITIASCKY